MGKRRKKTNPLLLDKYALICAEFKRLSAVKEFGVSKHSYEWILKTLSKKKFFLSEDYIAKIIRNEPTGGYKD